jgi:diguanylate cyclase (GGDEF)-like protein
LLLEALSLSPVALCLTTLDDENVEVNDSFADLIGRPATELIGRMLAEVMPRRRDDTLAVVLEEIDTAGSLIGRARLKTWSAAAPRMPGLPATTALADGTLAPDDLTNPEAHDRVALSRDAVTGLANRQTFLTQLARRVVDAGPDEAFALLCIDLDRFTEVNDSLGHPIGDQVLKVVAGRLRRRLRALDGVARLDGDEFAILLGGLAADDNLQAIAQRLSRAVEQRIIIGSHEIHLGCSIGIARYPADATDATALLRRADLALNDAKRSGRGTERMFEPSLEEHIQTRRRTESELYRGIERKEFVLHYQPIVELPSRRVMGVEALVRWNHPERGLIMPGDFIPLAEATGAIRALGAWVLHEACRAVASWRVHRVPRLWLAVNISAAQFHSGDLVNLVDFALTNSGLTASELELEITETAVLESSRLDTLSQLAQLKELGVTISVDDFGTGYGSMVYLRNFPVTKIKIDGSFVRAAPDHPKEAAIVRALCGLGRDLHMRILAEAVETEAQFSFAQQAGCTEAQGFLFSKPLPEADLIALLEGSGSDDGGTATRADWVFPAGSATKPEE